MNDKFLGCILIAFLLLICMGACEGARAGTITIVDGKGQSVEVPVPVERIVSISSRASEIICALGDGDKIVGRDSYSFFPPSIENVTVVAESSYKPNIELIHKLKPDLAIADSMLSNDDRKKIESAEIPVIIETTWDSTTVATPVRHIGAILDRADRAEEIISFIEKYQEIVRERTVGLTEEDKPEVFFEWSRPYYSMGNGTLFHNLTVAAGGINIVADEPVKYPTVDPVWLVEIDPDIIIRYDYSTEKGNLSANMEKTRDEILCRPELADLKAIKDGRVFILGNPVASGIRSVVGDLYLARWLHPDLFQDIDPEAVHRELLDKFFG
jgi:iron complex transport system substrate-binding protein